MLRHLMKLIWKRKSRNLMLSLEILLAFVVIFAISAVSVRFYQLDQLPVGIEYKNVWAINIETAGDTEIKSVPGIYQNFKRDLQSMPQVETVAFSYFSPYTDSDWSSSFSMPGSGKEIRSNLLEVSDDFFAVSKMMLLEGHWFSEADNSPAAIPVVINQRLAAELFPGKSSIGQVFNRDEKNPQNLPYKVTGVIDDYRNKGEFMNPVNFTFTRFSDQSPLHDLHTILLKVRPGTERNFEAELNRRLKLIRNDWSYQIGTMDDTRDTQMRRQLTPLIVLAIVAAFLLLMVSFGLFGVLWQNLTQRIPEIGLRRAVGAGAGDIYRQIIGEQLLLSSLAMVAALILLVQLPITGTFSTFLNWKVFLSASALSMAAIYLISLLCALYPGWQASRLSPTEALHYE